MFEIAGSLALLVAGGLMLRSAVNLIETDLGFRIEGVVRARLAVPQRNYPDAAALASFHERFLERISAETAAPIALSTWPPFYVPPLQSVQVDGADLPTHEAAAMAVTPDYFPILDIPISQGRAFTRDDRIGAEPVALVSESLARELWPDGAVGRRLRTGEQSAARSPLGAWRTVVGVVKDVRQVQTDTDARDVYVPFLQIPSQYAPLFIRTDGPASQWLATLRTAANELDRSALISGVTSLDKEAERLLAPARFLTLTLTAFAVFASFVAIVGIYAVTAYAVHQRERESAIRIAVGASESAVVRMFLKDGAVVLAAGIALGLLGAIAATRLITTQLYEIAPFDPTTLGVACTAMIAPALLAMWLAARTAARNNPIQTLTEN